MLKVIFLDFDGVLDNAYYDMMLEKQGLPNSDKYGPIFDPSCIDNLKRIVDATHAKIVVSSDWKYVMSFGELHDMWEARSLPGDMIDTTPNSSLRRGDEIDVWLAACREEVCYIILDDMDATCFNEHQIPRLLVVNSFTGLDEDTAERAIGLLQERSSAEN